MKAARRFAFLLLVLSSPALADEPFYLRILLLHELFYLAATMGLYLTLGHRSRIARLPAMFVGMNAALLCGFVRWAARPQSGMWKRTTRAAGAHRANANRVFLVGQTGGTGHVLYFDGQGWTSAVLPSGVGRLRGVWSLASGEVFAVGHDGTILQGP